MLNLHAALALGQERIRFSLPAGTLADTLDRFSEQSGLQTVYTPDPHFEREAAPISGDLLPEDVLDRIAAESGLSWRYVNPGTVLLSPAPQARPEAGTRNRLPGRVARAPVIEEVVVVADPRRVLPTQPVAIAFGLNRSLLETPRSLSVISEETIDLFSLSAVEDLVRVVPAVYTTTRFGIQGAVDVRNVAADTYVRGMKRVNLQGHGRSVLGTMDSIEIVRGPPSPLYGMGKIGGYTNVVPKSGRARLGGYLPALQGFTQLRIGAYEHAEMAFGLGGPLHMGDNQGGYYVHGLLEDSGTYVRNVDVGQTVLQGAISVDDFIGPFRLETGLDYQRSTTAGALVNRLTQDLVDNNRYVRGIPLANLDANGNGAIGFLEMHGASPAAGTLGAYNQPLIQRWDWPLDVSGKPLPLDAFPQVAGIPQTMHDYLLLHPEADPTGLLRDQGAGGPLPASGIVPLGFALDPRTVGYARFDPRRAGAYERSVRADFLLGFFDLVHDSDPDFTLKNQLFFDSMDQAKLSEQPGGGKQDVRVFENKFTLTRRWRDVPPWLQVEGLVSINLRNTIASGYRYVGDQGSHRTDASFGSGAMTANTRFVHPFDNPVLDADGAPWQSDYRSAYWETGIGGLLDVSLRDATKILLGTRIDRSRAKNTDYAGTLDPNAGSSAAPGTWRVSDDSARDHDDALSWSLSVSRRLHAGVWSYVTLAEASLTLESNNNRMPNSVIDAGHIGEARLQELGVKASIFDDRLFVSLAHYEQTRTDVNDDNHAALVSASASATTTRGWEAELKWVPTARLFLSLYGVQQRTYFMPNTGDNILVDARTLGFQDVLDAQGNVIYPAEAFLYGGRSYLALPDGMEAYRIKQGNPGTQYGLSAQYQLNRTFGMTFSANYFSGVYSGRLRQVHLPASYVANAGVFVDRGRWHFKFDVNNLADTRYFRPRTGDNLGETLVSAMPGRTWAASIRVDL
ncbi:MAG TPA: TonB-dependent receptor plug domain-containing protein [Pseudomonadales bacterium]